MARGIQNFPRIEAPDSDYPDGRIKDRTGSEFGTPVNEYTNGDIQQFFAKIMREAGVTANGLPDNEYSGNQYFEALQKVVNDIVGGDIVNNTGIVGGLDGLAGVYVSRFFNQINVSVNKTITASAPAGTIVYTLPASIRTSVQNNIGVSASVYTAGGGNAQNNMTIPVLLNTMTGVIATSMNMPTGTDVIFLSLSYLKY